MWNTTNPLLNGPFRPLSNERIEDAPEIEGEIPRELNGTIFRPSSNPQFEPLQPDLTHWFDSDGMVHAVTLEDGKASYRNRWVETKGLLAERQAGHALYGSFMNGGTPVNLDQDAYPQLKNPANTNAIVFDGRLLVFCEADVPHEMSLDTLDTKGMYDFHGDVEGPMTAHFKIDPDNGDMLFFVTLGTVLKYYRADKKGQVLQTHEFDRGVPSFHHDFAVTPDYAIFMINPSIFDIEGVFQGRPSTLWNPDLPNRIALLSRHTGEVTWIEQDETFAPTHILNAYQEDGRIVIDANRTAKFCSRPGQAIPFDPAFPWRWEIDVAKLRVTSRQMSDVNSEFGRFNETLTGKKQRYSYYAATRTGGFCERWLFDHLIKLDANTGRTEFQSMGGELTSPGEPVFVPRDGGTSEDDGWILSFWWDEVRDRSEVVIHHAQDFSGKPVARIKLRERVSMGFHGNWVPGR